MTPRSARRALSWAVIALALPRDVLAASGTTLSELITAEAAPSERAPLDLYVNGGRRAAVVVVLREKDVLIPVEDLALAGLENLAGARETIDGRVHVSLSSLAPKLRFAVDEEALALRITAERDLLGRTRVDLRPTARPPGLEPRGDPSGFLNYSVQHRTPDDRTSAFLEAGASDGHGRLGLATASILPDGRAVRGVTSLTLDEPDLRRRVVVGDTFATSSALGGGLLLGGLSIAREWSLDPYTLRAPLPGASGFAPTPSTLEVYVNGVRRREIPLAPGAYDLSNLPVSAGAGDVRLVLRDAFGRAESVAWPYYHAPTLLARGLTDYGAAVGFRRLGWAVESFEYGDPVVVTRGRRGVHDRVTLGGRLDAAADLLSAGPSATFGLPFGTLDLEAAASLDDGEAGAAASAGFGFTSHRVGAGTQVRLMSDRYAHAALRAGDERAWLQWTAFAAVPVTPVLSLGATYTLSLRRDTAEGETAALRADLRVTRSVHLGVSGRRTRGGRTTAHDALATLSWSFAPRSVADLSAEAGDSGHAVHAGVQRSLPVGTGFGYRARAGSGTAGEDATAAAEAQWEHGRYSLQYDRVGAAELGTATASGAVVVIGGRAFLARPVQDGYALVRTGTPEVRGYAEGQEVGRTDARGDLLVPSLLAYYGNRLGIADRDVPVDYRIGPTEMLAAPYYRAGIVNRFDVAPLRVVEGELVTGTGRPPAYGDLAVQVGAQAHASPIDGDGRFYLEALPRGRHEGVVEWSGGRCRVTLEVPEEPAIADLGRVPCAGEVTASAAPEVPPPPPPPEPLPPPPPPPPPPPAPDAALATSATPAPEPVTVATTAPAPEPAVLVTVAPAPEAEPALAATTAAAPSPAPAPAPATLKAPSATTRPPPPRGYGPRTPRCPSCAVCLSAALRRIDTPTAQLRCVDDLTILKPTLGRSLAAKVCVVTPEWDDLCNECLRLRAQRKCPSWPQDGARRAPSKITDEMLARFFFW